MSRSGSAIVLGMACAGLAAGYYWLETGSNYDRADRSSRGQEIDDRGASGGSVPTGGRGGDFGGLFAGLGSASTPETNGAAPDAMPGAAREKLQSRDHADSGWLVGTWVHAPEMCNGTDDMMRFEPDGSYVSYGRAGTWRLSADHLEVDYEDIESGEGSSEALSQGRFTAIVKSVDSRTMTLDGGKMFRCAE